LEAKIDMQLRTMRILWTGIFLSLVIYYVFTLFNKGAADAQNTLVSFAFAAAGLFLVILSFPIKQKFLTQSVETQSMGLVQKGYIVALAVCEAAALLGLLDHFLTGNRYYYLLFIAAVAADLLHFPQRRHLQEASYKREMF
jgi:hypothetical protein